MNRLNKIVRNRDYSALINIDINDLTTDTHYFAYTSACLFLGKIDLLKKIISALQKDQEKLWIIELMRSYLAIESDYDKRRAIANLVRYKERAQDNPYILGEIYFALGFLFHQIEEKELSFLFFKNSLRYFRKKGYKTHVWYVYLNLFLAKRGDLGQKKELAQYKDYIIDEVSNLPIEAQARALWLLSSIFYTDNLIEKALQSAKLSVEIARKRSQKIQEIESLIDLMYFQYKLNVKLIDYKEQIQFLEHRSYYTLQELISLINIDDVPKINWLNKLKNKSIHPLFAHRLIDIYLEKAIEEFSPNQFIDIVKHIKANVVRRPMFIPFYSLDFYLTLGFLKKEDPTNFFVELQKLENDQFFSKSSLFKEKYDQLLKEMSRRKSSSKGNVRLELNLKNHTLSVGSRSFSVAQTPLVEKTFKVLIEKHSNFIKDEDLFLDLYGEVYERYRHEARLASLISRIRSFLPSSNMIIRRYGKIKLAGLDTVRIVYPKHESFSHSKRHRKITDYFRRTPEAITALDLHKKLEIPLRTLQLDLKELYERGSIYKYKLGRKYFYAPNRTNG